MIGQNYSRHKGPEFLLDLIQHTADALQQAGLSSEAAKQTSEAIAMQMAEQWGGQSFYFPKGTWNGRAPFFLSLEDRNFNIYCEFDGTNKDEICQRHNIRPARLYQIIKAVRTSRRASLSTPKPTPSDA